MAHIEYIGWIIKIINNLKTYIMYQGGEQIDDIIPQAEEVHQQFTEMLRYLKELKAAGATRLSDDQATHIMVDIFGAED